MACTRQSLRYVWPAAEKRPRKDPSPPSPEQGRGLFLRLTNCVRCICWACLCGPWFRPRISPICTGRQNGVTTLGLGVATSPPVQLRGFESGQAWMKTQLIIGRMVTLKRRACLPSPWTGSHGDARHGIPSIFQGRSSEATTLANQPPTRKQHESK